MLFTCPVHPAVRLFPVVLILVLGVRSARAGGAASVDAVPVPVVQAGVERTALGGAVVLLGLLLLLLFQKEIGELVQLLNVSVGVAQLALELLDALGLVLDFLF